MPRTGTLLAASLYVPTIACFGRLGHSQVYREHQSWARLVEMSGDPFAQRFRSHAGLGLHNLKPYMAPHTAVCLRLHSHPVPCHPCHDPPQMHCHDIDIDHRESMSLVLGLYLLSLGKFATFEPSVTSVQVWRPQTIQLASGTA